MANGIRGVLGQLPRRTGTRRTRPGYEDTSIDIELTNACNARCNFCPRHNMPKLGLMESRIFYKAVERGLEFLDGPVFKFCGTGDALLHREIVGYAKHIADLGCEIWITTNGSLMTGNKAKSLIDAGVKRVYFSISSRGEQYEAEYGLGYERTHSNILRFIDLAKGRCQVVIARVLHDRGVDYEQDKTYWLSKGVANLMDFDLVNRAGALFPLPLQTVSVDEVSRARASLRQRGEWTICTVPFAYLFIGWDGNYYLCSSDWRKQAPLGHVDTHSIEATLAARHRCVGSRGPICFQCSNDPVNRYIAAYGIPRLITHGVNGHAVPAGDVDALADSLRHSSGRSPTPEDDGSSGM